MQVKFIKIKLALHDREKLTLNVDVEKLAGI